MRRQWEEIAKMADQLQQRLDALEALVNNLPAHNTNLQNKVTNLQNASAAATAAAPVIPGAALPAAAVAAPIPYAENQGRYDVEQVINFNTRLGTTVYEQGVKALTQEFDMQPEFMVIFLQAFQERCIEIGWSKGSKNITKFTNQDGNVIDLVMQYGQINVATLKTECECFAKPGGADYGTRAT